MEVMQVDIGRSLAAVVMILLMLGLLGLYIWSIFWAYGDGERRGKSGCLVALLVMLLSWPLGLIVWLIFRPEERLDSS